ncbi:MAG TPA: hypothetical protein VGO50_19490 [Pyrinomonadaceae bacterium]|jgi:hypothetical protein|nr:hypothetical protein [Pyrinomonadaceae bacterium]
MRIDILSDSDLEAKLGDVTSVLNDTGFYKVFETKQYDDANISICIVLMCRDPIHKFTQRVRFSKKENCLYMDIMLDLDQMKHANDDLRKRIVAEKMLDEIPAIIGRYKNIDFDLQRFLFDLKNWFEQHKWL